MIRYHLVWSSILLYFFASFYTFAQNLSIDEAIDLALKHSLELEKNQYLLSRYDREKDNLIHNFYPTAHFEYGKTISLKEKNQDGYFTPGISLNFNLKNPWEYDTEKKQKDLQKELVKKSNQSLIQKISKDVEKTYFKLQILGKKKSHEEQIRQMTQKSLLDGKQKHQRGFLSQTALEVLEIESINQDMGFKGTMKSWDDLKNHFEFLLGKSLQEQFVLNSKLSVQELNHQRTEDISGLEESRINQNIIQTHLEEQILSYQKWPSISFTAHQSLPKDINKKISSNTMFTFNLNWKIFDGFSVDDQKQKYVDQRQDLKQSLLMIKNERKNQYEKIFRNFIASKEDYIVYQNLLNRRFKILEEYQKRFTLGQISSDDFSDQFRSHINTMTQLFDLEISAIESYLDLKYF